MIDKPTRLGESSATLFDHFYTKNLTIPITSGILESDISDRLLTFVLIRSYIPPYSSASYKFRRHLNKIDYEQFNNELYDILQNKLSHNGINIHQTFDTLISTLQTCQINMHLLSDSPDANENLPKNLGSPKQLWFQSVIKKLFSKICKNRIPSATNAYKKYRNLLTRIKYKAKQNYYKYFFPLIKKF